MRLEVATEGGVRPLLHFVEELRENPEIRLLRLMSHSLTHTDILLGLREPQRLVETIAEMEGVTRANEMEGHYEANAP